MLRGGVSLQLERARLGLVAETRVPVSGSFRHGRGAASTSGTWIEQHCEPHGLAAPWWPTHQAGAQLTDKLVLSCAYRNSSASEAACPCQTLH
jgi:hypothetical protein